jgi:Protein of unknown function (DUF3987)
MSDFAAFVNQINVPPPPPPGNVVPFPTPPAKSLSAALAYLKQFNQFILWNAVPDPGKHKPRKVPCSLTGYAIDKYDSVHWTDYNTAASTAEALGASYGVGFVLTRNTRVAVLDYDNARRPDGSWHPTVNEIYSRIPKAAGEVSFSGDGLHNWCVYQGELPASDITTREINGLKVELFLADKFIALGEQTTAVGDVGTDYTAELTKLITDHFQPKTDSDRGKRPWTTEAEEGFKGPKDLLGLIDVFMRGRKDKTPTNEQLYNGHQVALTAWKPEEGRGDGLTFNPTAVDMLMAGESNFYNGNNFELTKQLMESSPYAALRADKWKSNVLRRETIASAYSEQVYQPGYGKDPNNSGFEPARASQGTGQPTAVKLPKIPPAPMGQAAFHGVVGDFARLVEPSTEGDINALVVTFLTAFGSLFGLTPHHYVEDSRHGVNLFSVIVGESSKARKGTVTDRVMNLLKLVDKEFYEKRVHKGLSTGEGLIVCVRDGREDTEPQPEGFPGKKPPQDPGVADKRLLALESEFASVLEHGKREGNILSAIMRDAWDSKPLRIMAKSNKDSCQHPHISLIGNITLDELQRCLSEKDRTNGFGNRILWAYAKRSKILSRPKRVSEQDLQQIAGQIMAVLFRMPGELTWSDAAGDLWDHEYTRLTESNGNGLVDSLTARAEAQVLRIAMLYAVLDRSSIIELAHLQAALEVWRYCEDSAKFIFGGATTNKLAEDILGHLLVAPAGMSQTELSVAFGRNKTAAQLKDALETLSRIGKVRSEERKNDTGRTVTVWLSVGE